jgi:CRISPR-associated protein Cmr2
MEKMDLRWRAKLAAWIHDPAEKAMVILGDRLGHEGRTVAALCRHLFGEDAIPQELAQHVRRADRWAAAADRPDRPGIEGETRAFWDRIRFPRQPVLVHPLSGESYEIQPLLAEADPQALSKIVTEQTLALVVRDPAAREVDWKATFLRLWRLAPEAPDARWGALWGLLPADTRVPDHSIWEHLRLTSALAGIFACGQKPALLGVSLGPVQSFIAQGRSTSDLWAGSHLLARMSWEALSVVCERHGPDALLLPDLHGVPMVDAWLSAQGVPFPEDLPWKRRRSDANPLFLATLPNRFVALVPAEEAEETAREIEERVRKWVLDRAREAWRRIREVAEAPESPVALEQIERQLRGFPEVYWAAAPWTLVREPMAPDNQAAGPLDVSALARSLGAFYPPGTQSPGFLGSTAWKILKREICVADAVFFRPNAGLLYPAFFDLLDRALASVRATRPFEPASEAGYRCSLCGEREWLSLDRADLLRPRGHPGESDPWPRLAARQPSWARGTEHLCALCALKRLWPSLFGDEVKSHVPDLAEHGLRRYVVSTHTMALTPTLGALARCTPQGRQEIEKALGAAGEQIQHLRVALPRGLAETDDDLVRQIPAVMEALEDRLREEADSAKKREAARKLRGLDQALRRALGAGRETYYALLLMDGDRLGAWLSSSRDADASTRSPGRPRYQELWHPTVREGVLEEFGETEVLRRYFESPAPPSPGYHAGLSRALNDLSLRAIPTIVEELCRGKVIYSGGDDLLAMLPVDDLLLSMLLLRCAYGGLVPGEDSQALEGLLAREDAAAQGSPGPGLRMGGGHVLLGRGRSRLLRSLGRYATASMGAVVAHHSAPLGAVLRELRAAEQRAKSAGRNAFSITLAKRGGGTTYFTAPWGFGGGEVQADLPAHRTPMGLLLRTQRALRENLSRRAAYHVLSWLPAMPRGPADLESRAPEDYQEMLRVQLGYQLARQARRGADLESLRALASDLAAFAVHESVPATTGTPLDRLAGLVGHAEFLARTERSGRPVGPGPGVRT